MKDTFRIRGAMFALAVLSIARATAAGEPAHSFRAIGDRLKEGDTVYVTSRSVPEVRGKLLRVTDRLRHHLSSEGQGAGLGRI